MREGKVEKLLHENYRKKKCEYIKTHDTRSVKRLAKKSRVEKLLEMVEMEMKAKSD